MDNNQNGDMLDKAKEGAKKLLSLASSPIKKYILAGVLSALPYVVIIVVAFVLILATLFSISEQLDSVYEESGKMAENIGERMGNVITLHGFKTNEQVAVDEEVDYYKRLKFFQDSMELTNYDLTLINNTVLYETNAEDIINISNNDTFTKAAASFYKTLKLENPGENIIQKIQFFAMKNVLIGVQTVNFVSTFFNNMATRYAIGFINSVAGASQYEKANKALLPVATAIKKCKGLTKDEGTIKDGTSMTVNMSDEFKTCYTGFLIAEDSEIIRQLVDINEDLSFVEDGELIFTPVGDILDFLNNKTDYLFKTLLSFQASNKLSIKIDSLGCLANTKDCVSKVAGYNGYIVNNLQEYYKYDVSQGDNVENAADPEIDSITKLKSLDGLSQEELDILIERYKAEDKNKRAIASDIFERTDGYFDATYGQVKAVKNANYKPPKGETGYAAGTSCSSISTEDLKIFFPVTSGCQVNSCFGVYAGGWACKSHKGIDVNASGGIFSVCSGTVTFAGIYNDGSASAVEVDCQVNGKIYHVRYLHMPMDYVNNFYVGKSISSGDYIGKQGSVGNGVTGAHLHLDVSLNGTYVNPEAFVSNCSFTYDCNGTRDYCESAGQYYCK